MRAYIWAEIAAAEAAKNEVKSDKNQEGMCMSVRWLSDTYKHTYIGTYVQQSV